MIVSSKLEFSGLLEIVCKLGYITFPHRGWCGGGKVRGCNDPNPILLTSGFLLPILVYRTHRSPGGGITKWMFTMSYIYREPKIKRSTWEDLIEIHRIVVYADFRYVLWRFIFTVWRSQWNVYIQSCWGLINSFDTSKGSTVLNLYYTRRRFSVKLGVSWVCPVFGDLELMVLNWKLWNYMYL